jgi:hypothetical protein
VTVPLARADESAASIPISFESLQPAPLSVVEEMFWNAEELYSATLRGGVVLWIDGCIEAQVLTAALVKVQRRHPKLRAAVVRGDDGRRRFSFSSTPPLIPFELREYEGEEPPWREEMRRLLGLQFPPAGPLLALSVLRHRVDNRSVLVLTVHHAIADGLSAFVILTDLLAAYAESESLEDSFRSTPLPVITEVRAPSGRWRDWLWLLRRFVRIQRRERRAPLTELPTASGVAPQSQWVHWAFSRDDTLALVRRCRKERASLTGAFMSSILCGLMDCLRLPRGTFKCQLSFDIRSALEGGAGPVTNQDLGCFASIMNLFCEVPALPEFWDVARRVQQEIAEFVEHDGPTHYHNLTTSLAGRLTVRGAGMVTPANQRPTLFVTHYGVLNMRDQYGSLYPRECAVALKNDLMGPVLVVEGVVLGQRLNVGVAATGLDPDFWKQLQLAARARLESAITCGHGTAPASDIQRHGVEQ